MRGLIAFALLAACACGEAEARPNSIGRRLLTKATSLAGGSVPSITNTKSIAFDGLNEYLHSADTATYEAGANITVCAFAKFTSATCTTCGIVAKWMKPDGTRDGSWALVGGGGSGSTPGAIAFETATSAGSGGGVYCESSSAVMSTGWKFYCATKSATTLALYVDGAAVATSCAGSVPATLRDGDADVRVGQFLAGNYMDGRIDEPIVYNVALSAAQIDALYDRLVADQTPIGVHGTDPIIWLRNGDDASDSNTTIQNQITANPDFTGANLEAGDLVTDAP